MHGQTLLQRRGATYYYRQRVPRPLQAYFDGRREIKVSLRTRDPKEARYRARIICAHVETVFTRTLSGAPQRESIGRRGYRQLTRITTQPDESHVLVEAAIISRPSPGNTDHGGPAGTPERAIAVGELEDAATGGITLDDLHDRWVRKRNNRRASTLAAVAVTVREFKKYTGLITVSKIRRRDVLDYRDYLTHERGLKTRTVQKRIANLHALFKTGIKEEMTQSNPASDIEVEDSELDGSDRLPYDLNDIHRIFSSPIYMMRERPQGGAGEAAAWLPALALYTGARLEEAGQLTVDDIKCEYGIHFIWITNIDQEHRVKTKSSRRRVPIHPDLIEAGFLRFVERRRKEGGGRLFPLLKRNNIGVLTANWSKWWGRYARKVLGITDRRKVFHSFRHAFKDAAREAEIEEQKSDAITGHAGGGIGRKYGSKLYPLRTLAAAIEKVEFWGFRLPVIEP